MTFPLYFDDDSQVRAVIEALRRVGIEAVRSAEFGNEGLEDARHLEFAASRGWAVVSRNARDFQRLHTQFMHQHRHHGGIVIIHQSHRLGVGEQIRRFLALQRARNAVTMRDRLEYLSNWAPAD